MKETIPVYLTAFNHLSTLRHMAKECERFDQPITIIDHGSTYPPLLEWYESCPYRVVMTGKNWGCYGFWSTKRHERETGYYIVSDSDLDLSGVPADAVEKLLAAFRANPWANKAGLSLEWEDIPDHNPHKYVVLAYERNYWYSRTRDGNWKAPVGATFALYNQRERPVQVITNEFYRAVRLDRPYVARHFPWYLDPTKLGEEDRYYFSRTDATSHYSEKIKRAAGL